MTVDDFVDEHRRRTPVAILCRAVHYSRNTYYARRRANHTERLKKDRVLASEIKKVRKGKGHVFGRRRVRTGLARKNIKANPKAIARVMRSNGWFGIPCRKKPRSAEPVLVIHKNLLQRQFYVDAPNTVWTPDVKEIPTHQGRLFLAAHEDLFSRYVVGFSFSNHNDTALVAESLRRAVRMRRPKRGLLHHSDQGTPFLSWEYQHCLEEIQAVPSCSAPGTPHDNACIESFFSTLQREYLDGEKFGTRAAAIKGVIGWIRWYNRKRFHSTLGNLSPSEYEAQASQ